MVLQRYEATIWGGHEGGIWRRVGQEGVVISKALIICPTQHHPDRQLLMRLPVTFKPITQSKSSYAKAMAVLFGAFIAWTGSQIELIIVGKLIVVFAKWIISALGEFFQYPLLVSTLTSLFTSRQKFYYICQKLHSRTSFLPGKAYLMLFTSSRVAGVIGETTFKFFIQYTSWAGVYCLYILIIMAIVIAEERTEVSLLFMHHSPLRLEQGTLGGFTHHTLSK